MKRRSVRELCNELNDNSATLQTDQAVTRLVTREHFLGIPGTGAIDNALNNVVNGVVAVSSQATNFLASSVNTVGGFVRDTAPIITKGIIDSANTVGGVATGAFDKAVGDVNVGTSWLKTTVVDPTIGAINDAAKQIGDVFTSGFNGIINDATAPFKTILANVGDVKKTATGIQSPNNTAATAAAIEAAKTSALGSINAAKSANAIIASNVAQFVSVSVPGDNKILSVAEVQIFDTAGNNIALNKPVKTSSSAYGSNPQRATDGNTNGNWGNGSVTHTNTEKNPYITVDLGVNTTISRVVVYNRNEASDRLDGGLIQLINAAGTVVNTLPALDSSMIQTRIVVSDPLISLTNGLVAHYTADSWDPNTRRLLDITSNGKHATQIQGTIKRVGGPNGKNALAGNTESKIFFPEGVLPQTYTLFHVCRYSGGNKARIVTGSNNNWLSGFWGGRRGVAYHEDWLTRYDTSYASSEDWVLSTDQNGLYRSSGVQRSTGIGRNVNTNLTINGSPHGERSDWQFVEMIVYDRTLTITEIQSIELYLRDKYNVHYGPMPAFFSLRGINNNKSGQCYGARGQNYADRALRCDSGGINDNNHKFIGYNHPDGTVSFKVYYTDRWCSVSDASWVYCNNDWIGTHEKFTFVQRDGTGSTSFSLVGPRGVIMSQWDAVKVNSPNIGEWEKFTYNIPDDMP